MQTDLRFTISEALRALARSGGWPAGLAGVFAAMLVLVNVQSTSHEPGIAPSSLGFAFSGGLFVGGLLAWLRGIDRG